MEALVLYKITTNMEKRGENLPLNIFKI